MAFTGISGYDHHFDFAVPKARKRPERIVQAITRPTRESALLIIGDRSDTRQVRASESTAYAVRSDNETPVSGAVVDAFRHHDIQPVPWSQRAEIVIELAA